MDPSIVDRCSGTTSSVGASLMSLTVTLTVLPDHLGAVVVGGGDRDGIAAVEVLIRRSAYGDLAGVPVDRDRALARTGRGRYRAVRSPRAEADRLGSIFVDRCS